MTLRADWKDVVRKAWSIRMILLAAVLSAAEYIIPLFADAMPRGLFAGLSGLAIGGAFVARLMAQRDIQP